MQGGWYTIDEQVTKVRRPYAQTPLSPLPATSQVKQQDLEESYEA